MGVAGVGGLLRPDVMNGVQKNVLVITNDSTVFLSDGFVSAYDMFGGRCTEVKNLYDRLTNITSTSFGIITGRFGFIPSNYVVMKYDFVPSCKADYERLQAEKDFVGEIRLLVQPFDKIVVCVPKDMFEMIMPVLPTERVIAVTNEKFKDDCIARGWSYYPRVGARVGKENADAIVEEIKRMVD